MSGYKLRNRDIVKLVFIFNKDGEVVDPDTTLAQLPPPRPPAGSKLLNFIHDKILFDLK